MIKIHTIMDILLYFSNVTIPRTLLSFSNLVAHIQFLEDHLLLVKSLGPCDLVMPQSQLLVTQ